MRVRTAYKQAVRPHLTNGGMTINMKYKFLSIFLSLTLLIPSVAFARGGTEQWSLSASWDFTENINNGFVVNRAISVENGEGELHWDHNIYTAKKYKKAKLEFDFRIEPFKNSERRFTVDFGVESDNGGSNFSYTDFTAEGGVAHFVSQGADGVFAGGENFTFAENTDYSICYVVSDSKVELYAKTADADDYTFVGEKSGLNIGEGKIKIHSHDFGYIKNLKIYTPPELSVRITCANNGYIGADDGIDLEFSHPVSESDLQDKIKLMHDGEEIPFTVTLNENVCRIMPEDGFLTQRRYDVTVEHGLRAGEVILDKDVSFTVNTKPSVTVFENFDSNVSEEFTKSYASAENGRLKIDNWGNIATVKEFSEYIAEFDYFQENTDGSGRIMIYPRGGVNNFVYIDINDTSLVHIVDDNGDSASECGMLFSGATQYSFRVVTTKDSYAVYAYADGGEFVKLTENNISGSSGTMQITSGGCAYLDNLKICGYDSSVETEPKEILARKGSNFYLHFASDMDDETVNADNIKLSDDLREYGISVERKTADTYSVTLNEWIEYGKEYKLTVSENVKSVFGTSHGYTASVCTATAPSAVSIENVKINGDEFTGYIPAGLHRITSDVAYNLTDGAVNAVCACVVYDEDEQGSKKIISKWQPISISASMPLQNMEFDLKIPYVKNPIIRIFIWDSLVSAEFLAEPQKRG